MNSQLVSESVHLGALIHARAAAAADIAEGRVLYNVM